MNNNHIELARKRLFEKDESSGYIERETAIDEFLRFYPPENAPVAPPAGAADGGTASRKGTAEVPGITGNRFDCQADRYVTALEYVLERLSTPVEDGDVIVGRMAEGPVRQYELEIVPGNGLSHVNNPFRPNSRGAGHMSLDYGRLLEKGLGGIAREAERAAESDSQKQYAALVRRAVNAVSKWATRWGKAAAAAGNTRAAEALAAVPFAPAYDFFSAIQSIWIVEMTLSCVTGGRDFAYSRLDLALLPYFNETESGDAREILKEFIIKNNEIGGLRSELNDFMPVPCGATNIYLMLGGRGAEIALPLGLLFIEAAKAVKLPQPVYALRLERNSPKEWRRACMDAAQSLDGQAALYNDDVLIPALTDLGYTPPQALNYTMSGCNRAEFTGHVSSDCFDNCAEWMLAAFYDETVSDMDGLLAAFDREARKGAANFRGSARVPQEEEPRFFLESLFLAGCMENARDLENGGLSAETVVHNLCGIGTVADSFAAIDSLVFKEKSITLQQYRELVKGDFVSDPALHTRISLRLPKYGNDDAAADKWAEAVGRITANAVRDLRGERIHIPSFYSLFYDKAMGERIGATPDGRLSGRPVSENQSPVYGRDTRGVTALLRSAAALPQRLCGAGGLNVRFTRKLEETLLEGLVDTYFSMGGINLAINIVSRQTLADARANPDQYRGLFVRVVGYSDVFLNLPEWLQLELIERTEVAV